MKERELVSMVDYAIYLDDKYDYSDSEMVLHRRSVNDYAEFLSQPLTLGMFVPCDEDGNVLDKPSMFELWTGNNIEEGRPLNTDGLLCKQYQAAKERVIFDIPNLHSCEVDDKGGIIYNFTNAFSTGYKKGTVVEELTYKDVGLTESTYNKYFK